MLEIWWFSFANTSLTRSLRRCLKGSDLEHQGYLKITFNNIIHSITCIQGATYLRFWTTFFFWFNSKARRRWSFHCSKRGWWRSGVDARHPAILGICEDVMTGPPKRYRSKTPFTSGVMTGCLGENRTANWSLGNWSMAIMATFLF